jgi:hypothetical protein
MESVLCMAGSINFKAIRTGATAFIFTSISMATMELGLGGHQTGWTGLVAKLLEQSGKQRELTSQKSRESPYEMDLVQ